MYSVDWRCHTTQHQHCGWSDVTCSVCRSTRQAAACRWPLSYCGQLNVEMILTSSWRHHQHRQRRSWFQRSCPDVSWLTDRRICTTKTSTASSFGCLWWCGHCFQQLTRRRWPRCSAASTTVCSCVAVQMGCERNSASCTMTVVCRRLSEAAVLFSGVWGSDYLPDHSCIQKTTHQLVSDRIYFAKSTTILFLCIAFFFCCTRPLLTYCFPKQRCPVSLVKHTKNLFTEHKNLIVMQVIIIYSVHDKTLIVKTQTLMWQRTAAN